MLIEYLKPDFELENESGLLVQLIHDEWKQTNVIFSKKGKVRGGHYHKFNKECFYVISGQFTLRVWNRNINETYHMSKEDMFLIPENVYHIFEYLEDTILISLYSRGVELSDNVKDIWVKKDEI